MARKKLGKIARAVLRYNNLEYGLNEIATDYYNAVSKTSTEEAYKKGFAEWLRFYLPQIAKKYKDLVEPKQQQSDGQSMAPPQPKDPKEIAKEIMEATSKIAAAYRKQQKLKKAEKYESLGNGIYPTSGSVSETKPEEKKYVISKVEI